MSDVLLCGCCGGELDPEESESPRKEEDGTIMCDRCFADEYRHLCSICEEFFYEEPSEKISPKYFLAVCDNVYEIGIVKGVYEIVSYPFFRDGIVEMSIIKTAIKKIHDFPDGVKCDGSTHGISYICDDCMKRIVGA